MRSKKKIIDWIKDYRPGGNNNISGYLTKVFILGVDLTFALFSFAFAVFVDRTLNATSWTLVMYSYVPLILLSLRAISFIAFKTYLIIIRFVGEKDFINLFFAATTSTVAFFVVLKIFPLALPGDRAATVVVVDYLFLLYLSGGIRIFLRILYKYLRRKYTGPQPNTVIYGAGQLGAQTLSILESSSDSKFKVVAFLDDNSKVHKKQLNGIPVYNAKNHLEGFLKKQNIEQAIIAIRDLPDDRRIQFINTCLENSVEVLKVPSTSQWVNNTLNEKQLRKVKLSDLLNRPAIELDKKKIVREITGQCVLVTGCAGSIGSEIVRQLLYFDPKLVVGIDQAETPLVTLKRELQDDRFIGLIGDVRAPDKMNQIFQEYRPQYVFHAAAYKHVPIMESHPDEAVNTNIFGSINIARAAISVSAKKFVLVSTDKVVNPTNVMGASKRAAEIFIRHLHYDSIVKTQFITTRFGNVLGSNGSVVPLFQEQIQNRQPLTVTHKDVTRYFMTIPEACQLVLEAGVMGNGGEILVFDMGQPVKIYDLARRLIQLSGLVPDKDIPIHITGLRPGEKLYEELLTDKEKVKPTHHPKIRIANIQDIESPEDLMYFQDLADLCQNRAELDKIVQCLKKLVPEYAETSQPHPSANTQNIKRKPSNHKNPKEEQKHLENLKGERGLKHLFLRTLGKVIPTDVFAPRHALAIKGICIINEQVLLLKTETGVWDLPGGKLKPGEKWQTCIKREVKEETNLNVKQCHLLKLQSHLIRNTTQVTIALAECIVNEEPQSISLSQEHFGAKLVSLKELQHIPLLLPYADSISEVLKNSKAY
ncbi:MAG: SDR family NAD(P)-dependent oxidoreductase [Bacteroidetes bacterium]|jgi:FlaA1/EpsC-like NDP-sugar epimerase/ADP-ribose pyrophosphatase YjhB (NUDIX family)|nr:SDR family NAD(P)-dependent oxidoreductase [Bacteroidota bacterium]